MRDRISPGGECSLNKCGNTSKAGVRQGVEPPSWLLPKVDDPPSDSRQRYLVAVHSVWTTCGVCSMYESNQRVDKSGAHRTFVFENVIDQICQMPWEKISNHEI